jgi:hypothetical protein
MTCQPDTFEDENYLFTGYSSGSANYSYLTSSRHYRVGNTVAVEIIFAILFILSVMILISQIYTFCCKMKKFNRFQGSKNAHSYYNLAENNQNMPQP